MKASARKVLSEASFSKSFWAYMASSTVVAAAEDMLSPFYPVYFKERFNLSMSAVSLLFALSGGIWNVMSVLSGWLAGKLGRKRVILASWLSSIADLVEEEKRSLAFGVRRILGNAVWVAAPAIGGAYLSSGGGFTALLLSSAALSAVGVAMLAALVPETRGSGLPPPSLYSLRGFLSKGFSCLCLSSLFTLLFYSQIYTLLPIYGREYGLSELEVGLLFSISGATVVALQLPTSIAARRASLATASALGVAVMAAGVCGIGSQAASSS